MPRIHAQRSPGFINPRQVPRGPVEVDWTHPLSRRLSFFYAPGSAAGLNDIAGNGPRIIAPGPNGVEAEASGGGLRSQPSTSPYGGGYVPLSAAQLVRVTGSVSWMWYGRYGAADPAKYPHTIGIDPTDQTLPNGAFSLEKKAILRTTSSGGGVTQASTSSLTITDGTENVIIATWDTAAGSIKAYVNGVLQITDTGSTFGPDYTGHTSNFALMLGADRFDGPGNATNHNLYAAGFWNTALTAGDVALLSQSPFAMLRPVQVRRTAAASSGSSLGFSARGAAISRGQAALAAAASIPLRGKAISRGRSTLAAAAALQVKGAAASRGQAQPSATAGLQARGKATSRSAAMLAASATVQAKGSAASNGRAALAANAALLAAGFAGSGSRANLTTGALLAFLARGAASSQGRAALGAAATIAARGVAAGAGRANLAASASLLLRGASISSGRAGLTTGALLAFLLRGAAGSGGRAGLTAAAAVSARGRATSASQASLSAAAALLARGAAGSSGRAFASSAALLQFLARGSANSRGRAAMAAAASIVARGAAGSRGRAVASALAAFLARGRAASRGRLSFNTFRPPYAAPMATAATLRQVATGTTLRVAITAATLRTVGTSPMRAIAKPVPEIWGAIRSGLDVDSRARDWSGVLADLGDSVASIGAVTVTRQDGVTMGAGDLSIQGTPSIDSDGYTTRFGIAGGIAGVVYVITIRITTAQGRTLQRDGLLAAVANLG